MPTHALTSLNDTGKDRRPRDIRLIHILLSASGVPAYSERVPLQLLDFAYRYTSGVLGDALHAASEGYTGEPNTNDKRGGGNHNTNAAEAGVTINTMRLAIQSRTHYQMQGHSSLPKETLQDMASDRNRVALPGLGRGAAAASAGATSATPTSTTTVTGNDALANAIRNSGLKLPPERYCLSGQGWGLKEEWVSEGEEEVEDGVGAGAAAAERIVNGANEDGEEDEDERMEDVFGRTDGDGDEEMGDD